MQFHKALKKQTVTRRRCHQQNRNRQESKVQNQRRWRGSLLTCFTDAVHAATVNDQWLRLVRVLGTSHVATFDDRSRRWPEVHVGKLAVSHPPNIVETGHSALCTSTLPA